MWFDVNTQWPSRDPSQSLRRPSVLYDRYSPLYSINTKPSIESWWNVEGSALRPDRGLSSIGVYSKSWKR